MENNEIQKASRALIDDDLNVPGYEIVRKRIRLAASDLELCYTLGEILDKRADAIRALTKVIKKLTDH